MKDILSMYPAEIKQDLISEGFPKFRADQIISWLSKDIDSFDSMNNISKDLRSFLKENYRFFRPSILKKQVSADGTIKYLWKLIDGNAVETVVMQNNYGNTVCISTQVGCRQGCAFCASTIGGLIRCLEPYEMLNEVFCSQKDFGGKISNVVLMGIGEPLDNFENVVRFIKLINDPRIMNIGMRHVTVSTCGITERFDELSEMGMQINLAVSLHAPDDETRSKIMPANHGRGIDSLMEHCKRYFLRTGRRISFEYAMIDGINDSDEKANALAERAKYVGAHVNLIPLNHVEESRFIPSSDKRIKAFIKILENKGINVTVRRRLGSDVDASCGQLRRKFISNQI